MAEFERDLIRERTQAGLAAARARGRQGGWPRTPKPHQIEAARKLLKDPETRISDVVRALKVPRTALYRYLNEETAKHATSDGA